MAPDQNFKRQQYSAQLKSHVVGEFEVPGASVARVAMAHGINANIVHSWRQIARTTLRSTGTALLPMTTPTPTHFVPAVLPSAVKPPQHSVPHSSAALAPATLTPHHIEVELHRGTTTLKLKWPVTAFAQLGAWTREVLG
jgi:transposase